MKTFKEYLSESAELTEGPIWDWIKSAGAAVRDTAAAVGAGVGHVVGAPLGGLISGIDQGKHGYGYGHYGSNYGSSNSRYNKKIKSLKSQIRDLKSGTKSSPGTTGAPGTTRAPVGTTRAPVGTTRAPVGTTGAPGTTRAPVGTTRAPVGTTRAPVGTTGAPGTTRAPVGTTGAPVKILSKAEKKDKRELSRTSGGITKRIGTISTTVSPSGSIRLFNHETINNMKKAAVNKLGNKYAAVAKPTKTNPRGVRKGTTEKQLKAVNTTRGLQLGKEVMQKSIANNPELANKLAAQRMRVASARAKQGKLMGFSEQNSAKNLLTGIRNLIDY